MITKHVPLRSLGVLLCLIPLAGFDLSSLPPDAGRNEHTVMSVLWFQRSAEMRALFYQAFNLAKLRIDERGASKDGKKRAVVVDIDETVLDNSPHSAKLIKEDQVFPYAWSEWINRAEAEPLPGAVEFLSYAVSRGYDVFYVSNRSAKTEFDGTIANLKKKRFPQAENDHILLRENESSKEPRRLSIERTHEIVLLMGDNLNDLASVFERRSMTDRSAVVDSLKNLFGDRFIVLPNPMYGDWESAAYGYQRGLTDEQKNALRKEALKGF